MSIVDHLKAQLEAAGANVLAAHEGIGFAPLLAKLMAMPPTDTTGSIFGINAPTPESAAAMRAAIATYPEVKQKQFAGLQVRVSYWGTVERLMQLVMHLEGLKALKEAKK